MHEPIFYLNPENSTVVVFIHGFMGSPRQFERTAHSVHAQGFSAASLLLPGHGYSVKEFSQSTSEKWQNSVNAEIERFSLKYNKIFLVGHSMGCLLAINAADKYCGKISGLYLIACPFRLKGLSVQSLKVRLKQIFYSKTHPMKATYFNGSSVPLSLSLLWRSAKPAAELRKLMIISKANLHNIRVPVTAVYSSSDEVVSADSLEIFKTALDRTLLTTIDLSDSYHAYYPEHEQSVIESTLISAVALCQARQDGH